jgi:23S rRNA (uridine2552-2'-O)-methyltransferase
MNWKVKDHYYKKAKKENFLARSIYKLEEIDKKYRILKKGDSVLDLGYYPGSWVQYTTTVVGTSGKVLGIDIQPVNKPLLKHKNVQLFEKSIFDIEGPEDLNSESHFDVILSDMAPKTTGIKSVDQDRSLELVESVFGLLPKVLKKDGTVVVKVFESNDAQVFLRGQRKRFKTLNFLKPKSTRSVSKEFFVIGKGYLGL